MIKLMIKLIKILIVVSFVTSLTLISIEESAFNFGWYQNQFIKNNVYQKLSPKLVDSQTKNLLSYLKGNESLDQVFYTPRELDHLVDIKKLVGLLKNLLYLSLAILVGTLLFFYQKQGKANLIKIVSLSAIVTLIFYALLSLVIIFGFDRLFLLFHQVSFSNDFWLLDPNTENLINIFPPELFFSLTQVVVTKVVLASTITLILTKYWLKKSK